MQALARTNTIASLASGSVGPELGLSLIESGQLLELSQRVIMPTYRDKMVQATKLLEDLLEGVPARIHEPEGSLFLWLWCPELPITSRELYERLKSKGVLVIPGEDFFPGIDDPNWSHQRECLRISYAQPEGVVSSGLKTLSEEVIRACEEGHP